MRNQPLNCRAKTCGLDRASRQAFAVPLRPCKLHAPEKRENNGRALTDYTICGRCAWAGQRGTRRNASLQEAPTDEEVLAEAKFGEGIAARVTRHGYSLQIDITSTDSASKVLHWAVNDWNQPEQTIWPEGTNAVDDKAVQTPFEGGRRIRLRIPADQCPHRLVFVVKELSPERWVSNGGVDFAVQLKAPDFLDVSGKALRAESTFSNWSLFDRFCLANELLDAADSAGPVGMAFMLVWLRLSKNRQLDWYRNSSHQSKDIAHVQKTLAQRMSDKARGSANPENRYLARLALGALPRGGGDGDAIRMGILHIMRENGIREGHRPGIEEHFLEQWHQKLHTNTTPEDINICEAYLGCLHTGYPDDFWRFLWENGGITRDQLATMDRPITATPMHLPHLIGPFQHYLWILKTCHAGADMDVALEMARGRLDGDLAWNIGDLLQNRNEWWVPGKLVELRERLAGYWKAEGAPRDVLLLDIALDNYLRICVERIDKSALSGDDLVNLTGLVLRNAVIANDSRDLQQCVALWEKVCGEERWSRQWALQATAAAQRLNLSLAAFADRLFSLTQPHAEEFKKACGIDPQYITNFGEEVIRGQPLFVLSLLLQKLDPMLRRTAELGAWQVVSQAEANGVVRVISSLADIQGQEFQEQTVIIADHVGGNEDIPESVTAVLTSSTTDVLSHVAIRARSQKILLATCHDEAELGGLKALEGSQALLSVDASGAVTAAPAEGGSSRLQNGRAIPTSVSVSATRNTNQWALRESEFHEGLVGGKSRKLAELRSRLPGNIALPSSIAIPFGSFEKVLRDRVNNGVASKVDGLVRAVSSSSRQGIPAELDELRRVVSTQLQPPYQLVSEVASVAEQAGIISPGEWRQGSEAWNKAWRSICGVWASKWNDRAWLSRKARGIRDGDLKMAVLLQKVIPAEYAFVIHTASPVTGARDELFGEVVVGMGEALVGNKPGRALSFSSSKSGDLRLQFLPSKRAGLFSPAGISNVIARSDSNGEDLEAFAGAGLYDSIPLEALEETTLETAAEGLFWDAAFRIQLLADIAATGFEVERALGTAPQDIEGVWRDGKITVVQARPQVL